MRIDIAPDTKAVTRRAARKSTAVTTFVARRQDRADRNTPYDKLLASVYDAVLIADVHGRIIDFNERALEFLKFEEAQLPGRSVLDFISGADESLLTTIRQNLEARTYTVVEACCTRSDGSAFPAEIAVNLADLDGEGRLCFFIRDTTVRKRAQQELENAIERLQALDRSRLEFVSNVSHELRTPLTSMIYAVRNMLRGVAGPLPEKAVQYLGRLDADCQRLLGTVNDILDLRQIENHTLTINKKRLPLARLVETGVDALRVQADEKRVQLLMCLPACMGFVLGDHHKLERVVLNIVGNALKFTPAGGAIHVFVECDTERTHEAVMRVRDTGIGIPPEALDKITLRYFKVGDQPVGSGLGLAISRELVELHGGTLRIESPAPGSDRGTQVSVFLPLTEPPRLLAASGDQSVREQARRVGESQGYVVDVLEGGRPVLEQCRLNPPDVLLVDQSLPDLAGMDLILQLRNDRRHARLPIVMLAGEQPSRTQLEILKGLNIHLLGRPPKDQDLIARLSSMPGNRRQGT